MTNTVSTAHRIAPDLIERAIFGDRLTPWPRLPRLGPDPETCRRLAAVVGVPHAGPMPRFLDLDPAVFERAARAVARLNAPSAGQRSVRPAS